MMVCLVALVALPAMAHAATSWQSAYPAPAATVYGTPGFISIDVFDSNTISSNAATVGIGAQTLTVVAGKVAVTQGSGSGGWTATQTETPVGSGYYVIHWTWSTAGSGTGAKTTIMAFPSTLAAGSYSATYTIDTMDAAGAVIPVTTNSTFTVAANNPAPPTNINHNTGYWSIICAQCHAGYETDPAMGPDCTACHQGGYQTPNHATATGTAPENEGGDGHNVAGFSVHTKFDGTGGLTLNWTASQSFAVSTIKFRSGSTTDAPALTSGITVGSTFTTGQAGVVQSNWAFPTKSVFWASGDASASPYAITGLTPTSVITCTQCHNAAGIQYTGPHGAVSWAMDSNFPADWSMALLTKKVTGGTSGTSLGSQTGRASASGIAFAANTTATAGTPASKMAVSSQWQDGTGTYGNTYAVICAKCHKLETAIRGYDAGSGETSRTPGTSGLVYTTVEGANTAHDSVHQDQTDGRAQCVSCHAAIPHGWKLPRLLVDVADYEGTPYVSENAIEEMETIAALNNHPLIDDTGFQPFSTSNGAWADPANGASYNIAHSGTVLWDESQCDACGDHYGNNVYRNGTTYGMGNYGNGSAVPVRIDNPEVD